MKNIFVICLMLVTGLTQAQTFDFSCEEDVTYTQKLNNASFSIGEGSDYQIDLNIGNYVGTVEFIINDVAYNVTSDGTTSLLPIGDLTDMSIAINVGGTWTFRWTNISQDNIITWDFNDSVFGNLYKFMPKSGSNAIDLNATPSGVGSTLVHANFWRTSENSSYLARTYNESSVTYTLGGTTIHVKSFPQDQHITFGSSSESKFNNHRIKGGTAFDGWVLIQNGNKIDVIAKWGHDSVVEYAYIIHDTYSYPDTQGNPIGYGSQHDIRMYKVPGTNFNN